MRWHIIFIIILFFLFGNYGWNELKEAFLYYGKIIIPEIPFIGALILIILIILILFTDEIGNFVLNHFGKVNLKKSMN